MVQLRGSCHGTGCDRLASPAARARPCPAAHPRRPHALAPPSPPPPAAAVWDRQSGEVYLEGELERGVVPEDCFWTHCGGGGEDGCALYLRKMNLELLQR